MYTHLPLKAAPFSPSSLCPLGHEAAAGREHKKLMLKIEISIDLFLLHASRGIIY
jgi:hypothetical protein